MTDHDVCHSLEELVLHLRGELVADYTPDTVAWRIQDRWKETLAHTVPRPSNSDLTGVLRTIMNSLEVRTRMTPGGRGYLSFLIDFLKKTGFNVRRLSPDEMVRPIEEEDLDEDEEAE